MATTSHGNSSTRSLSAAKENSGIVFNTMRFSIHDGPGIRTTVFLKGCPLRCGWCHNPESQDFQPHLMLFAERCRLCGDCVAACPRHGIGDPAEGLKIPEECDACGSCAETCVAGARELAGRRTTVAALMDELRRDVLFFDESGGGVTISGGEPLAQPEFTRGLLTACREQGIHSVLDTSGFASPDVCASVSALADLVLYDLKAMDSATHARFTGVPNEPILANLRALAATGKPVIVRFPLIPDVNDSPGELAAVASFVRSCGLARIDMLPYHRIGAGKYARLGGNSQARVFTEPSAESINEAAEVFRREGLNVRIGGG
jgi:pyruvate formate lyase activating enzyme